MGDTGRTVVKRTTILDVAKRAGVGKVTVSYVLNGRSQTARISEETSRRVLQAAQDLNYSPNALARMLSRQRADAVAVVFQYASYFSASSGFTSDAMRGVCTACVESDVDLMLHTKRAEDASAEASNLMDGRVDGVLILRDRGDETLLRLVSQGFPTVQFFTREYGSSIPFVDADNRLGGQLATRHLIGLGHRLIAMVAGPRGSVSATDRAEGYRDAHTDSNLEVNEELILRPEDEPSVRLRLEKALASSAPPTAVFAWSDDDAFECMKVLAEAGYRIPDDISVVGFDSSDSCKLVVPSLTSVRQPVFEMAYQATRLLLEIISGNIPQSSQLVISPELVIRCSTGPSPTLATSQ